MIDEYARVKERFHNQLFRKQRMLNVLNEKDWFYGFDSLLSKTDSEQTMGQSYFRSDVRKAFEDIGITSKSKGANNMETTQEVIPKSTEEIVYRLVGTYISAKLKSKYQLEWNEGYKGTPKEVEYNEKKSKIAREAFLAIRSRTESDFIDYFASTLCAFPQFLNEQGYATLAEALHCETDKVRTLTMLALSARG
jgi:CRISPR-associated protein Cmx8